MIKDIKLIIRKAAEKSSLSGWERKHGVNLPKDLKDYYFSTNGFKLTWSLEHAGDILKIGEMHITEIKQLVPLDSSTLGESGATSVGGHNSKTLLDSRNVVQSQKNMSNHASTRASASSINDGKSTRRNNLAGGSNDTNFEIYYSELRQTMVKKMLKFSMHYFPYL